MVNDGLSQRANNSKWVEARGISQQTTSTNLGCTAKSRFYVDLRVLKRIGAILWQPIVLIGNCTRQYAMYGKCEASTACNQKGTYYV
jgi:hypothetical protein